MAAMFARSFVSDQQWRVLFCSTRLTAVCIQWVPGAAMWPLCERNGSQVGWKKTSGGDERTVKLCHQGDARSSEFSLWSASRL